VPFKSEAQRRKFKELLDQGKVSQQTFNEMERSTSGLLPERVSKPLKVGKIKVIGKKRRRQRR